MKRSEAMALIVYRLMTTSGVSFAELERELGIKDRARRYYREAVLELPETLGPRFALEEIRDERGVVTGVRLKGGSSRQAERDVAASLGALQVSRALMASVGGGTLRQEFEQWATDLRSALKERGTPEPLLAALEQRIVYMPRAPRTRRPDPQAMKALVQALLNRERVRLTYQKPSDPRGEIVTVEPYLVAIYDDGVYLVAKPLRKPAPRTYAVERIARIEPLGDRVVEPQGFTPEAYFRGSFGIFRSPDARLTAVELRFANNPALQAHVQSRRWHQTQKFRALPDGRLQMTLTVDSLPELAMWVRSFGEEVEVVEPKTGWEKKRFGEP